MAYRGVWASEDAYIRWQLREHLPEFLSWVLDCCESGLLRTGYMAGVVRVWSIPAAGGQVHVFESARPRAHRRLSGVRRVRQSRRWRLRRSPASRVE